MTLKLTSRNISTLLLLFILNFYTSAQEKNILRNLSLTMDFKQSVIAEDDMTISGMNSFLGYKFNKMTIGINTGKEKLLTDNTYAKYNVSGLGLKYKIKNESFSLEPFLSTQISIPKNSNNEEYWGYDIGICFSIDQAPDIGFVSGFEHWFPFESNDKLYSLYIGARISFDSIINSIFIK